MKSTTIRELKHETGKVLGWVADGESVEVRRRGEPVAILSSPRRWKKVARPDFAGRLRQIYGNGSLKLTATELISQARGES